MTKKTQPTKCSTYRTWLVWDRRTAALLLEVRHVPTTVTNPNIAVTLAYWGYWPINIDAEAEDSVANDYITISAVVSAPDEVVRQMKTAHRHIEWDQMWAEGRLDDIKLDTILTDHNPD